MRKGKKWLCLLLTLCMLGQSAVSVWADEQEGQGSQTETTVTEEKEEEIGEGETVPDPEESMDPEQGENTEENPGSETPAPEESVSPEIAVDDHGDGTLKVEVKNYEFASDVKNIVFAIWSDVNGQDDLQWYETTKNYVDVDLKDHNDDLGVYYVHLYENLKDGGMRFIVKDTVEVAEIDRPGPALEIKDSAGDEKTFRLTLRNFEKATDTSKIQAAIWSDVNGQDDLKWYDMTAQTNGNYIYDFVPASHKSAGQYEVHIYEKKTNGKMNCLLKTTLQVSAPVAEGIEIRDQKDAKGECSIAVKGVSCPSGVTSVQIAVWSEKDQSDLKWYDATLQEDGSWTANMKTSNHKDNTGTYSILAYAVSGNNTKAKIANSSVSFSDAEPSVSAEMKNGTVVLSTKGISTKNVREVLYSVWSEKNGQDDQRWITASYNADKKSASCELDMKGSTDYGTYQVLCYTKSENGRMKLIGNTSFELEQATVTDVVVDADKTKGSFTITVKGITGLVEKIEIPIWCKDDQSDIVWYTATKNADGDYVVTSDISKHNYDLGTYKIHVYMTDNSHVRSCVAKKTMEFDESCLGVRVVTTKANTTYTAIMSGLRVPTDAKKVEFAVWSEADGQDDLVWYAAEATSSGEYQATISVKNHKTDGNYFVHGYYNTAAGKKVFVGDATFSVESKASVNISCTDNLGNGGFTVRVSIASSSSPVSKVEVPVWSKSDQSDLKWYTATKQSDGTYVAEVQVANHNMNTGKYTVHVYTTLQNGIRVKAGADTYTFKPVNLIVVQKPDEGIRKLTLLNYTGSSSSISFPVWSEKDGQDDLKWYSATKQSNGTWTATVSTGNHKDSGNYIVHCYDGNSNFLASTSFTVSKDEMEKTGWYYENGYKFYYSNGKKLTNLTSILGAQSSYVAKINRTTCTVTIYANDPAGKGYIIPVIAFTCSVGLPATPTPAGTFYTFAKYRWKELMGPSYGQYATKFTSDGCYFHSVAGINMTSYNINSIDYNNLGIPASHGCVRLCVRDAKWIYDNCPLNMKVIVYNSSDPGPYGKPATIKIPAGQTWDPTDPAI